MTRNRPSVRLLAAPVVLALVGAFGLTACSGDDPETVTVLAAASLTGSFTTLAETFEDEHPGVKVELVLGSSGTLADQVLEGGAGDVLATADTATMDRAASALAGDPRIFATNTMVLVVPADNPAGITSLADLDDPAVDYVLCVDTAPCGAIGAEVISQGGIGNEPVSLEVDVKAVLARVTSGEVDAGLVYVTDAVAAGDDVESVALPDELLEATDYPVAVLTEASDADLAAEFVDLVLSPEGQKVLAGAGFGAP